MIKLGISAFYHDSAAAIVENNKVIAAAEEERFTGIKHDKNFPINAIKYCLAEASIDISRIMKNFGMKIQTKKMIELKLSSIKDRLELFFFDKGILKTEKITVRKIYYKILGTQERFIITITIILILLLVTILLLSEMQLYFQ